MPFDKLIYLASPHTHRDPLVREIRYQSVMKATAYLIREGHLIFSPIVHTHVMAQVHTWPQTFDYYRSIDLAWIAKCDELWVLMLEGWDKSQGVMEEVREATKLNKPVVMVGWHTTVEGGGKIGELTTLAELEWDKIVTNAARDKNSGKQQPFEYDPT